MEELDMRKASVGLLLAVMTVSPGMADGFDYLYTADRFPESEAWWRHTNDPFQRIRRGIDNGVFWLDTRASLSISDLYKFEDLALEPSGGEPLRITWRMRTLETNTFGVQSDVALAFRNSAGDYVQFFLAPEFVFERGSGPPGAPQHLYRIAPQAFHTYVFETPDGQSYDLNVDGEFAFEGIFQSWSRPGAPQVVFGDTIHGNWSLSEWDFIRIQLVPEPGSGLLVSFGLLIWKHLR
jgi:hypothetical protein